MSNTNDSDGIDIENTLTLIIGTFALVGGVLSYISNQPVPEGGLAVLLAVILFEVRE